MTIIVYCPTQRRAFVDQQWFNAYYAQCHRVDEALAAVLAHHSHCGGELESF